MAVPPQPPIVRASGLTKAYRRAGGRVEALRGVDLLVETGEFLLVMGPSGGGKSTLLNLIGGLDRADGGTLEVAGSDLTTASEGALDAFRRTTVGFVFQFFNLIPTLDARDNVALALIARGEGWDDARRRSSEILGEVGLEHRADHRPAEMSGGEQQRVAIARAVAGEPPLLLADEPTGDVDGETTTAIMDVLAGLNRSRGVTVVMVSHDTSLTGYASRRLELRDEDHVDKRDGNDEGEHHLPHRLLPVLLLAANGVRVALGQAVLIERRRDVGDDLREDGALLDVGRDPGDACLIFAPQRDGPQLGLDRDLFAKGRCCACVG